MRLPDVLGVLGALVVGGLLTVLLLASAVGEQPALPTPVPPTIPPLPSFAASTTAPSPTDRASAEPTVQTGVAIGQRAPAIEVTLLDGSVMNTADFSGSPLWVNFMATWCPQCQDELPMMRRFNRQLDGAMTILIVDVGEDPQTVRRFMRDLGIELPVGVDQAGTVQDQWGVYGLPVHFWLDEEGIVREIVYGGAPEEIFVGAITTVVPEFVAEGTPIPESTVTPQESLPPEGSPAAEE
jgi:cytochrome c biogenesis protein CcmG, thiol:disulfide interchange protein DsbE